MMDGLWIATLLAVFIGIAVGLFGGGGSILTTPLLIYVMGFQPKPAIVASLVLVAVTSAFGLISHARAGRVQWKRGLFFGGAGMVGAFIGGQIGALLPGSLLLAAFAAMMGFTAIAMVRGRKKVAVSKKHAGFPVFRVLLDGAVVGLVTGLVGAGGGFLVVPALALLGGLPMPVAVGTSLLVVMMKSVAGFLGYMVAFGGDTFISWNSEITLDWTVIAFITVAAIIGALIGSVLAGKIHPDKLRKAFGWFVLAMAVFILAQELGDSIIEFASTSWINLAEVVIGAIVIIVGVVVLIRWPAKQPIADYEAEGIEEAHETSSKNP